MLKLLKSRKGFTLVELMVVVVILGILVAIAVPMFGNVTGDAKEKADKATARTILSAVTMASSADSTDNPTQERINDFLSEPKIVIASAATSTNIWAVNKNGSVWEVYKWDGTASKKILP